MKIVVIVFLTALLHAEVHKGHADDYWGELSISINNLFCIKTTEQGEDEIYFIVTAKTSDGRTFKSRVPKGEKHYSVNDGNDDENRVRFKGGKELLRIPLELDQSAIITVTVMEQDRGDQSKWADLAENIVRESGTNTGWEAWLVATIGSLFANNPDDHVGTFEIRVGKTKHEWKAISGVSILGRHPNDPYYHQLPPQENLRTIKFRGSGRYSANFIFLRHLVKKKH